MLLNKLLYTLNIFLFTEKLIYWFISKKIQQMLKFASTIDFYRLERIMHVFKNLLQILIYGYNFRINLRKLQFF